MYTLRSSSICSVSRANPTTVSPSPRRGNSMAQQNVRERLQAAFGERAGMVMSVVQLVAGQIGEEAPLGVDPPGGQAAIAGHEHPQIGVGGQIDQEWIHDLQVPDPVVRLAVEIDEEAVAAAHWLCRHEGILPALESAHALAWLLGQKGRLDPDARVVLNLSGRGDKDLSTLVGTGDLS